MLLAVPAFRALRAARPAARLVLAAQERIAALLALLGAVDDAVDFDALGLDTLFADEIGRPEPRRFFLGPPTGQAGLADLATMVCWLGARDPAFVARVRALVPSAVVASSVPAGGLVWEHLLATAGGEAAMGDRAPLDVPAAVAADGERALRASGWDGETPLLIVHPGAGGAAKRWPAEGFARVLAALGSARRLAVVVHQGPADADAVADLARSHRGPLMRLVDPPLPLLAGALAHAAAWLGNDSGVSHLAAALGVPTLALFTAANLPWRSWSDATRPLVVATETLREADGDRVIAGLTALLR